MNHIKQFLTITMIALLCSGCFAIPPAAPTAASSWDQSLNATARVVVNATFFAPTHTPTPTMTPTITLTPTPSPALTTSVFTPTVTLDTCIPAGSESQTGKVTAVLDAETILVDTGGQEHKVRYIGIRAPRDLVNKKLYGEKAAAINRELVQGQTVRLVKDTTDTDPAGRLLRYVYVGNIFVNLELVRLGLATVVSNPPDTACFDAFHEAEHEASVKRAGMWSRPNPTKTPLGYGIERMTDVPCNCYADADDFNCFDFDLQMLAQSCFNYCRSLGLHDVFHLDPSGDDIACDFLP